MSLLDNSYRAFINLDHRKDRLDHMNTQLDRIGMKAKRIPGMLPEEYEGDESKVAVMKARTPGAIGCHFSQVEIMKYALLERKHALIMEDDIIFCEDFNERIKIISKFTSRTDWDVFFLGGTFHVPAFWHKIGRSGMEPNCSAQLGKDCELIEGRIVRTYGAFSTYAYFVNVNSIFKIFDLFDKHLHESIGIDWLFIKLQPQLKCFAFVPGSVKQKDNLSDIGIDKNGVPQQTVFSGFSKLNGTEENSRYWFQEQMEDFDPKEFNWI